MARSGQELTMYPHSVQDLSADMSTNRRLSPEQLVDSYYTMVLSRLLEERMWALNRLGQVAIVGSWYGQEAAQIGAARALTVGLDFILPYYRDVPLTLAVGMTVREQ